MTNVFISWSGNQSKEIAEELRLWIPSVLQFAKPYFTPDDIEKGAKWSSEISTKLSESNVGIVCLTKQNFNRPWILFEAGALSKDLDKSKVCSVLFGMENTDLTGPLTTFQATQFDKRDFKKLIQTINQSGGENALSQDTLSKVFEMWWPEIESKVQRILSVDSSEESHDLRSDRDILEELLLLARSNSRNIPNRSPRAPRGLVRELLEQIEILFLINERQLSHEANEALKRLTRLASYLAESSDVSEDEVLHHIASLIRRQEEFIPF